MGEVLPLPGIGEVFEDVRGSGRTMRVSHHPSRGIVVVSLWSGPFCRASFQLPVEQAGRLAAAIPAASVAAPAGDAGPADRAVAGATSAAAAAPIVAGRSATPVERTGDITDPGRATG